jgi:hypothetical protein
MLKTLYQTDPGRQRSHGATSGAKAKSKACHDVSNAVASGALVRPHKCDLDHLPEQFDRRGTSLLQFHHYLGYALEHRRDVVWLCSECHEIVRSGHPADVLARVVQPVSPVVQAFLTSLGLSVPI